MAIRAVLGQQVTVKGATTLVGRLVQRYGLPLRSAPSGLTHTFPRPSALVEAGASDVATLGIPKQRAHALVSLASAVAQGLELRRGAPVEATMARLRELPGIGEWTAQYLAMRALSWPDAFPASDLGVLRAMATKRPRDALTRAEAFRPWRAYATLHFWSQP